MALLLFLFLFFCSFLSKKSKERKNTNTQRKAGKKRIKKELTSISKTDVVAIVDTIKSQEQI